MKTESELFSFLFFTVPKNTGVHLGFFVIQFVVENKKPSLATSREFGSLNAEEKVKHELYVWQRQKLQKL